MNKQKLREAKKLLEMCEIELEILSNLDENMANSANMINYKKRIMEYKQIAEEDIDYLTNIVK